MTHAKAQRIFSAIVDIARLRNELMELPSFHGNDDQTACIDSLSQGFLSVIDRGRRSHPSYDLQWEPNAMPKELELGEPAPSSSYIYLSESGLEAMLETIFDESVKVRPRREAAIEHWSSILNNPYKILLIGPQDEQKLRAFVKTEQKRSGKLLVKSIPEADDFRVIWTHLTLSTAPVTNSDLDLTDCTIHQALRIIDELV